MKGIKDGSLERISVSNRSYYDVFTWGMPGNIGVFGIVAVDDFNINRTRSKVIKQHAGKAPSQGSHPSAFRECQADPSTRIMLGRGPSTRSNVPPTLLDPILHQFRYDATPGHLQASEIDRAIVMRLLGISGLLKDEKTRREAFSEIMSAVAPDLELPTPGHSGPTGAFTNDGELGMAHMFYVHEVKNELAGNNSEPAIQSVLYWINHWTPLLQRQSTLDPKDLEPWEQQTLLKLHCPVVLVQHAGKCAILIARHPQPPDHSSTTPHNAHSSFFQELLSKCKWLPGVNVQSSRPSQCSTSSWI